MPRGQAWQSKQGNPFRRLCQSASFEVSCQSSGVRAIPADHDVYPWGDEPSGAMIQTEPSEPKLSKILQDPSSLHNVNRTGRHSGTEVPRGCKPFLPLWMTARRSLVQALIHRRGTRSVPRRWWSLSGSNRRPPACKAGALPAELRPHLSPTHQNLVRWDRPACPQKRSFEDRQTRNSTRARQARP